MLITAPVMVPPVIGRDAASRKTAITSSSAPRMARIGQVARCARSARTAKIVKGGAENRQRRDQDPQPRLVADPGKHHQEQHGQRHGHGNDQAQHTGSDAQGPIGTRIHAQNVLPPLTLNQAFDAALSMKTTISTGMTNPSSEVNPKPDPNSEMIASAA